VYLLHNACNVHRELITIAVYMNYYQLENKTMDEQFLNNRSVRCRVAISAKDVIEPGQELIVMLSTGAKYKGKITVVDVVAIGNRSIGEIEIVRSAR
jgi:hypothetical protein